MKHKIRIWVSPKDDEQTQVLKSGQRTIRAKLMKFLFGDEVGVLVLTPGRTVETVEIRELPMQGGEA